VPVRVIASQLALRWNLGRFGPQFLKAQDVGPVALDPFAELCSASTNSVHVPGGDSHVYSPAVRGRGQLEGMDGPPRLSQKNCASRGCYSHKGVHGTDGPIETVVLEVLGQEFGEAEVFRVRPEVCVEP
jgi:hypothetical protein